MMVIGLVGCIFFWSCIGCVELIRDGFSSGNIMGWATLVSLTLLVGGFCYLCIVELAGYFSIRRVDYLSRSLAGEDVHRARRLGMQWMHSIKVDSSSIEKLETVKEIRQQIVMQLTVLDSKADKLIAKESVQIAAFVGISPWPIIDGAIVAWRQLRMVRLVAMNYGVRPSAIGTFRLMRRVLVSVVLADVSQHATQWIASKVPSIGGLIPTAGQSLAMLVLTMRVGKGCKVACRPLSTTTSQQQHTVLSKILGFFNEKTAAKEKRSCCS
ncbi:MAG: YcjF family protein [Phycisphaerales bacterium]|jgi:uncharacterized membrane protein YcjF (UPF0283 family)|nr:YcjF family protein [Phycisphaerales bacterium]